MMYTATGTTPEPSLSRAGTSVGTCTGTPLHSSQSCQTAYSSTAVLLVIVLEVSLPFKPSEQAEINLA